jgi:hypothetical protein
LANDRDKLRPRDLCSRTVEVTGVPDDEPGVSRVIQYTGFPIRPDDGNS